MQMDDEIVDYMIKNGYLEHVGDNKYGEPLYKFSKKFYEEQKELVDLINIKRSDILMSLWFKGFIEFKIDENSSGSLFLTGKSDTWYSSDELDAEERSMMYIIYSAGLYNEE